MTRRYDLIVVDLDGTLLNRAGQVSARNAAAIREATDAGYEVVIATGRAHSESRHAFEPLDLSGVAITAGGAMLCDVQTGRTLQRRAIEEGLVQAVARSLVRHGHVAHVLKDAHITGYDYLMVGDANIDAATDWWFRTFKVQARFVDTIEDDPHPAETVRIGTVSAGNELAVLAEHLRDDLGDRIALQHWPAVTESHATGATTHLLEAFSPRVDKWTMIEHWCAENGIDPARTAAIGDGLNDVQMIRGAGLGIAMANADPAVMHEASRVTTDHDDDGVAQAIRHILDGRW